ncbi:S-adenosyl-L-methionine-dependent methyltransferase [Westerdykella ornata]|uniref:S-adenosyl-L-methionine-dependent methyltransferase n=1 Tax=Westerdykella ornata TaxID=318751 RepID=A0A6A6JRQ6_WESOR|nr:S-adenosyl-L-methionine-dependent methyltransferase [Westerdykella ornata]KAF2279252.1 S-adenosyl-L-methionine-dependent methyltransferase [Westerdykella ornata]
MAAPSGFTPKQMAPRSPGVLDAIQGTVTKQIAKHALSLAPPITSESIVHDNACGTGAVTETIMEGGVAPAKLHATDLMPPFAQIVAGKAQQNGWGFVETAPMNAMELGFPDNTFTHSISNFFIQAVPVPAKAAAEIYRTVKPGQTAIVTSWAPVPHSDAIETASEVTRGKDVVLPMRFSPETYTAGWLEKLLKETGFSSLHIEDFDGYCHTDDLRQWCTHLWSFMGAAAGGWTPKDEEDWDLAIDTMVKTLKENPDVEAREDGSATVKMVAHIAIATK